MYPINLKLWTESVCQAFATVMSARNCCQQLAILPSRVTKNEIQKLIPEASMYLIGKSRKLKEKHSVRFQPDPYTRYKVSSQRISAAREYYTKDELGCS